MTLWAYVPAATAFGWEWSLWSQTNPVGAETVTSAAEVAAAIRTFGAAVARMLRPADAERFAIAAYGAVNGLIYGRAQWAFNKYAQRYIMDGDPWCPREVMPAPAVG